MIFGGFEWIIIIVALVLLFGAKHIPKMVRGAGKSVKLFRKATNEFKAELEKGPHNADDPDEKA